MIWADRIALGVSLIGAIVLSLLLRVWLEPNHLQAVAWLVGVVGGSLWLVLRIVDFMATGRIRSQ